MSKHTPGPWTVEKDYTTVTGEYVEPMIWAGANTATPKHIAVVRIGLEGTHANAYLIAAAPTLLEECKFILARLLKYGEWDDGCFYYSGKSAPELQEPIRRLTEVIAKAKDNP